MAENTTTKRSWLDRKFKLSENGTTVRTEVIAGLTTFMAMVYILMVNAGMFSNPFGDGTNVLGVSYGAIYIATALSAIIGTILIGLLANLPLAQASGMGLNAFFVYTCVVAMGFTYANALVFILIDGVVFVLLTVTGLRKKIFSAIPKAVRIAIPAGIGLFIAFIGAQNAKLVVADSSTGVAMGSMNLLGSFSFSSDYATNQRLIELIASYGITKWLTIMPVVVTIIGTIAIAIMSQKKIKGAIFYGIVGSAVLYYLLAFTTNAYGISAMIEEIAKTSESDAALIGNVLNGYAINISLSNPFTAFGEWADQSLVKVFTEGFDFSGYLAGEGHNVGSLVLLLVTSALAFCIVDMFDTLGTLYGACSRGNMLTAEGEVPNMNRAMLADAIATCTGAVCGTSTVTTFVESSAGIAEGGRTGLTSMVVALSFVVAMFLAPIAQLIPNCATATALIYVGVLMMNGVKELDWTNPSVAVPSFLTIAMMVFTYNISFGIGFGILSYIFINLFTGKAKEINVATYVLGLLFIAMFLFTH